MKTSFQTNSSTRISQSEAILNAIQAGFFEAVLDKKEVKKVFRKRNCQSIRLNFSSTQKGQGSLQATVVSRKGRESLLVSRKVVCNHTHGQSSLQYSVDFAPSELYQLLKQPGCIGLRIIPGTLAGTLPTLVAVGVQSKGFDMDCGSGYIQSHRVTKN